jgi:endonuclease/exonuclease/phosphatase family metal-dependent hydrolase
MGRFSWTVVMTKTLLFWNFNIEKGELLLKSPSEADKATILARVVQEYQVDILALAECKIPDVVLLDALRAIDPKFDQPVDPHPRIKFFTRFPGHHLEPWHADGRLSVRRLQFEDNDDILLASFHYVDRRNNSPASQHQKLADYKRTLLQAESKAGHRRMILFGDLNINPYEIGMLDPQSGLGAMMTRDLAEVHANNKGDGWPRFYNPMWSVMGRPEAPGTFYWDGDDPENPYWHCLDAVLVRPELRETFRDDDLRIIRMIPGPPGETIDLVRLAEVHWKITCSDHLPILFKLRLRQTTKVKKEDDHA